MKCEGFDTLDSRENSDFRKIRPGRITIAACARCPAKDSSSFLVQLRLNFHESNNPSSLSTLCNGSDSSKAALAGTVAAGTETIGRVVGAETDNWDETVDEG